ncbi:MAG: TfoX/Sxy family protein [Nitrospirales bacterium]
MDYLHEVFGQFGSIQPRRMFGGDGIFHKGLMFALVADDVLYLKSDETIVSHFEERELEQFEYEKNGKGFRMSYYMAPEEIFDDPEIAKVWAARSYAAAFAQRSRKRSQPISQRKNDEPILW